MITPRRSFLATSGAAILAASGVGRTAAAPAKSRTFVLVHGSWHGGWCWTRVADRLRAAGHQVFTPTLTGLADRSHLLSGGIDLGTHVADIVNLFRWYDLSDVVLVAHSSAGWPVAEAIETVLPRLSSTVYVDAFMPEDKERGVDVSTPQNRDAILAAVARSEISRPPPLASVLKIQRPEDVAWVQSKMTAQPIGVSLQRVSLSGKREQVAKKAYVRSGLYAMPLFDRWHADARGKPGWQAYLVPDSGHEVMIDSPERLTRILIECA
jgi:pimeloyl-ACP methyl ester carboxylesterase